MKEIISAGVAETRKIGADLAKKIKAKTRNKAVVIGLTGELGSGKTAFVQGFAKGLGIKGRIVSPTFILMRRHNFLYHFDAYRVNKAGEILDLGWKKIIKDSQNIIIVEWAEKIDKVLPKNCIKINLEHVNKNKRKISFTG